MLSYPDRHKFEQIRSQWEAAQVTNDETQSKMVGRREKSGAHQPFNGDENTNTGKFRRKLSHGLSFMRRTTPVRPPVLGTDLTTAIDVPYPHESTRLLSPMHEPTSYGSPAVRRVTPHNNASPQMILDPDATPKQLPRSRTMSYIPRPSRSASESSMTESDLAITPQPSAFTQEEIRATPTKIPSPDPSDPTRLKSSPRQYHPNLTSQQEKYVAAGTAFAGAKPPPSAKPSPVRSYTTPNLAKATPASGSSNFMSPRKSNQHRLSGIPAPQRPSTKENSIPASHRHIKRLSNIQEHSPQSQSPKRESLMAPTIASKRRSTGPVSALARNKQEACTTPPASSKRKSSQNVTQTPLAAQRALPKKRSPLPPIGSLPASTGSAVTQNRLLGPVSPQTPATVGPASVQSSLPRSTTEKDLRKRTFSTPYKKMGGSVLARSQAGLNNEVRFPRSSTYHHLVGELEEAPPMPPIPEQYKSVSMPMFFPKGASSNRASTSRETTVQDQDFERLSLDSSNNSTVVDWEKTPLISDQKASFVNELVRNKKSRLPKSKSKLSIQIPKPGRTFSASLLLSAKSLDLRSAKIPKVTDIADIGVSPQVKDYMPSLYWAGRFQSRYDLWRTEAMQVELNPGYSMDGPLSHCNVHQDKAAACHIFLQLRDLCLSHQAADSLWEFEHRYRQDNNLLGTSFDLPPLNPKPDDGSSKQGSFGRAIRKMTPRKSSFVNLLKGKGWNVDDLKSTDGSADCDLTSTKTFESSEYDHTK